ncbi:hypothetical protein DPX16_23657 [Anabarilius grahami]|uniref:Uncharacterized protein n=1 Tax=Anabarilius grahami TaxID=495550 RepID=A0A3N0XS49_ANAGA|nr:hypothetical protein DPX16_23657 [Anabarilius grahami]
MESGGGATDGDWLERALVRRLERKLERALVRRLERALRLERLWCGDWSGLPGWSGLVKWSGFMGWRALVGWRGLVGWHLYSSHSQYYCSSILMASVSDVSLPLSAGEDTFELHAVQLELEAVERQILTLLEKQAWKHPVLTLTSPR